MKTISLGTSGLTVPAIAVGCMRIGGLSPKDAENFVRTALEEGANFFDHADIYGGGKCEEIFAKAVGTSPAVRKKIILQSKCGIRPGISFDFSKEYILASVDGILERLNTEYLDVLLLHRPDALCEPEEVAEAFDKLEKSGKVRHFGVSNHNPGQIKLLQKYVKQPIIANQMQLSIINATMITGGTHVNMLSDDAVDRDGSVLDFCRLNDITIQPWSPFQDGVHGGVFIGSEHRPKLNAKLNEIAAKYGLSSTGAVVAWILRHPANMQPIIGSTNIRRLKDCIAATDVHITREEWYEIYLAAGHTLP